MTAHKFWRLLIQDNNGGDTVNLKNIALSTHSNALNLLPANTNFSGNTPFTQHEILFELAEPFDVNGYSFQAQGATAPKKWLFQYSDNNIQWHTAHLEYTQTRWLTNEYRYFKPQLYELNLNIAGSTAASGFNVFVNDLDGNLITKESLQNGDSTILMPDAKPVCLTVFQECGEVWKGGKYYGVGALIFPTNLTQTPFYYRNRYGGITGDTQPTWLTDTEKFTLDGTCTWELVERFNQPISQAPLIPVRKL